MLVHRTKEKKVFWELAIIMQNMSHNLLLFCAPTWPSYHVNENRLLIVSLNLVFVTCKFSVLYWHNNVFSSIIPQTANDKFVKEKQSGRGVTERETMLKDLATAYDIYMELLGNLQEGTKVK